MAYTLICPSKAETTCTGFIGGMEKQYRGRLFRVEFRRDGVICKKNNVPITWEKLPNPIRKAAHQAAETIKSSLG